MLFTRLFTLSCHQSGTFVQNILPDCASYTPSPDPNNPAAVHHLQASRPHRQRPCRNNGQAQPPSNFPMPTADGSGTSVLLTLTLHATCNTQSQAAQLIPFLHFALCLLYSISSRNHLVRVTLALAEFAAMLSQSFVTLHLLVPLAPVT